MESHLIGAGLKDQFPSDSLSPITFMVWELASPQKSWNSGLGFSLPKNQIRLFSVLFLLGMRL